MPTQDIRAGILVAILCGVQCVAGSAMAQSSAADAGASMSSTAADASPSASVDAGSNAVADASIAPATLPATTATTPSDPAPVPTSVAAPPPQPLPITAATAPQAVPDIALAPSTPHPSGHASTGLPAEVTAALGSGVTVHTLDDSFSLTIRARMQVRATLLTAANGSMDLPATEFQIRRARLLLQGHFFAREFQYYLQLGFSDQDTEPDLRLPLRDAYITWTRAA